VVDAYLDAKVEHDFLETRAGKLALAIEKLKHTFVRSGVSNVGEYVVPDATFQPLVADIVKTIRPILENAGIPADKVAMIASEGKVFLKLFGYVWFCAYALDLYGWVHLGDVDRFGRRGCVGMYVRTDGTAQPQGTKGDRHPDDYKPDHELDPFPATRARRRLAASMRVAPPPGDHRMSRMAYSDAISRHSTPQPQVAMAARPRNHFRKQPPGLSHRALQRLLPTSFSGFRTPSACFSGDFYPASREIKQERRST
jgi:hypothetical protein